METLVPSALHRIDRITPRLSPVSGHMKDPALPSGRIFHTQKAFADPVDREKYGESRLIVCPSQLLGALVHREVSPQNKYVGQRCSEDFSMWGSVHDALYVDQKGNTYSRDS